MEIEKLIDSLKKCANHHMCVGCLFASDNGNCIDAIMRNAATALEQLQAENDRLKEEVQQMWWIPVEERLPRPEENPVLVYDYSGVSMAWHTKAMGWSYKTGLPCVEVTHWMPLPQPPKEGTNGKH